LVWVGPEVDGWGHKQKLRQGFENIMGEAVGTRAPIDKIRLLGSRRYTTLSLSYLIRIYLYLSIYLSIYLSLSIVGLVALGLQTPGLRLPRTHPAPHTFTGARKGVLETVAAVRTRRRHASYLVTGPGSRHGLGAQPGTWSPRIPAMASSQGDVRPSPMAYPAVRPLPKLPLPPRPDTGPTS
jgi:hypothetical protein